MASRKRGTRPRSTIRGDRPGSKLRADAAANRTRVLAAAASAFAEHGVAISLDDIARRAGVGPGTVHRHFRSKAELIDATIAESVESLVRDAKAALAATDAGDAFRTLVHTLVERGAASHALAHRLIAGGVRIDVAEPVRRLRAALATVFRRAQRAGGIRGDATLADLDATIAAAHAAYVHPSGGRRVVAMIMDGLTAKPVRGGGARR